MVKGQIQMNDSFCFQQPYNGREILAAQDGACRLGIDYIRSKSAIPGLIPVGTVEFCEPVFGRETFIKNFYPAFLRETYITRKINLLKFTDGELYGERNDLDIINGYLPINLDIFTKQATVWKGNTGSLSALENGFWYISEAVKFTQEWRYYVANGELLTTGWYDGNDENEPAPLLSIKWPKGFSGAVDFGRLDNGRMELVEAHAPYGCGWYGDSKDNDLYALWLIEAWNNKTHWLGDD